MPLSARILMCLLVEAIVGGAPLQDKRKSSVNNNNDIIDLRLATCYLTG